MHSITSFCTRWKWADIPLRSKGIIVLLLPIAALLLNSVIGRVVFTEQQEAQAWVLHTLNVRSLLEQENGRLRKAVADLTLEKLILKEAASGNY